MESSLPLLWCILLSLYVDVHLPSPSMNVYAVTPNENRVGPHRSLNIREVSSIIGVVLTILRRGFKRTCR